LTHALVCLIIDPSPDGQKKMKITIQVVNARRTKKKASWLPKSDKYATRQKTTVHSGKLSQSDRFCSIREFFV